VLIKVHKTAFQPSVLYVQEMSFCFRENIKKNVYVLLLGRALWSSKNIKTVLLFSSKVLLFKRLHYLSSFLLTCWEMKKSRLKKDSVINLPSPKSVTDFHNHRRTQFLSVLIIVLSLFKLLYSIVSLEVLGDDKSVKSSKQIHRTVFIPFHCSVHAGRTLVFFLAYDSIG